MAALTPRPNLLRAFSLYFNASTIQPARGSNTSFLIHSSLIICHLSFFFHLVHSLFTATRVIPAARNAQCMDKQQKKTVHALSLPYPEPQWYSSTLATPPATDNYMLLTTETLLLQARGNPRPRASHSAIPASSSSTCGRIST